MQYPSLEIRGVVVAQAPNPPLATALAAAVVGWLADEGSTLDDVARAIFYVALAIWAWEEASRGVNRFRQVLGVAGLAYVVVSLARALG